MERRPVTLLLDRVQTPADLKTLSDRELRWRDVGGDGVRGDEQRRASEKADVRGAERQRDVNRVAGMDAAQIEAKVLETLGVAVVGLRA